MTTSVRSQIVQTKEVRRTMTPKVKIAILISVCVAFGYLGIHFLAGCSTPMTAKQRSTWMLGTYNSQYADYLNQIGYAVDQSGELVKVREVTLTPERKKALASRKEVLTEVYPLILLYSQSASKGLTPDRALEDQIVALLNRL